MSAALALPGPQPFGRKAARRPMLRALAGGRQQNPVTVVGGSGTVQGSSPSSTTVQFSPQQNWWLYMPYWGAYGWGWGAPYSYAYWGVPQYPPYSFTYSQSPYSYYAASPYYAAAPYPYDYSAYAYPYGYNPWMYWGFAR